MPYPYSTSLTWTMRRTIQIFNNSRNATFSLFGLTIAECQYVPLHIRAYLETSNKWHTFVLSMSALKHSLCVALLSIHEIG